MHAVPKTVSDKVQAYPALKNMKGVQAFAGILEFGGLSFPTWHGASAPCTACLMWEWGPEWQATFD